LYLEQSRDDFARSSSPFRGRMRSGQQQIQKHTNRIDIRRGRDSCSGCLLWRGVFRSQDAGGTRGEWRTAKAAVGRHHLGDPEVEQLRGAVIGHEDVGGLDVAVNDLVCMRVLDRGEDLLDEIDASARRYAPFVSVVINPGAFDVLEDQVGLACWAHPRVEKAGDARMGETGEQGALAPESRLSDGALECQVEQLDRGSRLPGANAPPREPHRAHATGTQRSLEPPGTQLNLAARDPEACIEEPAGIRGFFGCKQEDQLLDELGRLLPQIVEPLAPLFVTQVEGVIQQRLETLPQPGIDRHAPQSPALNPENTNRYAFFSAL
jgi:hypothetical protein